jgi:hypothetical protein
MFALVGIFLHFSQVHSGSHQIQKSDISYQFEVGSFNFEGKKENNLADPSSSLDLAVLARDYFHPHFALTTVSPTLASAASLSHYLIAFFHTGPPVSLFKV